MKMKHTLTYNNYLSVHDQINENLPNTFPKYFIISSNHHTMLEVNIKLSLKQLAILHIMV